VALEVVAASSELDLGEVALSDLVVIEGVLAEAPASSRASAASSRRLAREMSWRGWSGARSRITAAVVPSGKHSEPPDRLSPVVVRAHAERRPRPTGLPGRQRLGRGA